MIFGLDLITESNKSIINTFDINKTEESYLYSAFKFVEESNKELITNKKVLYRNLLESGNDIVAVNESFSEFFTKVKEIIKKFLKFIKSLFDRFVLNLNKLVLSDKYLNKHMKDLLYFSSDYEFKINGFTYTFDPEIPLANAQAQFTKEFGKLDFSEMVKSKDSKDQLTYITDLYDRLCDYNYDDFRKEILKGKAPISEDEFNAELYKIFRNGDESKQSIDVTPTVVDSSTNRFKKYKEEVKAIQKNKDDIDKDYKLVESQFSKMISRTGNGDLQGLLLDASSEEYDNASKVPLTTLSPEAISKVELYIKGLTDQIQKFSNIHATAFAAKLEAFKEQYKQDKYIMYTALDKVNKKAYNKIKHESANVSILQYVEFMNEQMYDTAELEMFVKEASLIGKGQANNKNMSVLEESFADTIKAGIMKVLNAIATIWRKFLEGMDTLIKNDKSYLEKYKDIILKKQLGDNTYTMYDYPTALKSVLNNATVPQFNYEGMKDKLNSDDDFVKAYFNNFAPKFNSKDENNNNFRANLISTFRGSPNEIAIPSTKLNMTDIFNYCYNYDAIKNSLDKDIATIKNGATAGLNLVDKLVNQAPATNNNESTIYQPLSKRFYSHVYESYVNEEVKIQSNGAADNSTNQSAGNTSGIKNTYATQGSNVNNTQQPVDKDKTGAEGVNKAVTDSKNDKDITEIKNQINRYILLSGQFMEAKKDIYMEIYKTYMTIIKNHVRANLQNAGKDNKTGDTQQKPGTNYQSGDNNSMVDSAFNTNPSEETEKK